MRSLTRGRAARLARTVCLGALFVTAGCASPKASPSPAVPLIDPEFARFCTANPCRGETVVELVKDDGTPFHLTLPMAPPIVQPGFVSIYAGETIILEADVEDHGLVNLRAVPQVMHPDKSVEFRFAQDTTMQNGSDMVLAIRNGFGRPLKYRLGMLLPSDPEPSPGQPPSIRRTSICPVQPGTASYEHWPHAIYLLVVADLRLIEAGDPAATVCE